MTNKHYISKHINANSKKTPLSRTKSQKKPSKNQHPTAKSHLSNYNATLVDILWLLPKLTQVEISKKLNIPKQKISRYVLKAIHEGLLITVIDSRPKFYEITKSGAKFLKNHKKTAIDDVSRTSSQGTRAFPQSARNPPQKTIRAENIRLKFKIEKDNPNLTWDHQNQKLNNWVPKYLNVNFPFNIDVTKKLTKTTKSIIITLKKKEFIRGPQFQREYQDWIMKIAGFVPKYLETKLGISLEPLSVETINQELANGYEEYEKNIDKSAPCRMDLNRKVESVFGVTPQKATAWLDFSPGHLEGESNDLRYQRNLIMMPEYISQLYSIIPEFTGGIKEYTAQITMHLDIMKRMGEQQTEQTITFKAIQAALSSLNPSTTPPKQPPDYSNQHTPPSDWDTIREFWKKKGKEIV